jgi:hypothetical protein
VQDQGVGITVRSDVPEHIARNGSACLLRLESADPPDALEAALEVAAEALYKIPHPDEPEDGLPNLSTVRRTVNGPMIFFDIKDQGEEFAAEIIEVLQRSLDASGVSGVLRPGE